MLAVRTPIFSNINETAHKNVGCVFGHYSLIT